LSAVQAVSGGAAGAIGCGPAGAVVSVDEFFVAAFAASPQLATVGQFGDLDQDAFAVAGRAVEVGIAMWMLLGEVAEQLSFLFLVPSSRCRPSR
jgi:hypothetical protein